MKLKMEPTSDPLASANSEIASNIIASYLKIVAKQRKQSIKDSYLGLRGVSKDKKPGSVLVIHHKVINGKLRRSSAWKGSSSWGGGRRVVSVRRWSSSSR